MSPHGGRRSDEEIAVHGRASRLYPAPGGVRHARRGCVSADGHRRSEFYLWTVCPPFYLWKKKYGSLGAAEGRELRQMREENARLKRVVADLTLDKHILQEVLRKKD